MLTRRAPMPRSKLVGRPPEGGLPQVAGRGVGRAHGTDREAGGREVRDVR